MGSMCCKEGYNTGIEDNNQLPNDAPFVRSLDGETI